ncbi:hypothetical protein BST86_01605 [Nonlabens agnitus]|uniref:Uncharacterized protein n=1 Tax=Nonlabens agnitus TaxID=870484 RepID=A0A2S9WQW1_9FLAO|nr:hypothetical protein BST86_01605 [Nonlabens agnitus]
MKFIINFYDRLFLFLYNLKKGSDDTPQYLPIILISVSQAWNLFLAFIIIYFIINQPLTHLPKFLLILIAIMIFFNFYLYQIKGRQSIIFGKSLSITFTFKAFAFLYIIVSIILPLLIIFILNELV